VQDCTKLPDEPTVSGRIIVKGRHAHRVSPRLCLGRFSDRAGIEPEAVVATALANDTRQNRDQKRDGRHDSRDARRGGDPPDGRRRAVTP